MQSAVYMKLWIDGCYIELASTYSIEGTFLVFRFHCPSLKGVENHYFAEVNNFRGIIELLDSPELTHCTRNHAILGITVRESIYLVHITSIGVERAEFAVSVK